MTSYEFHSVPHAVIELGAAARLGEVLSAHFDERHACIITGPSLFKSGLLGPALKSLATEGWRVEVICDVPADPPQERVQEIADRARALGCELVIGFGGGSPMDVAKVVAVLLAGDQPLEQMYGIDNVRGRRLPLVLIPTTAGTGSEVTPIAIVTTGKTTKSGIVAPQLYADLVILDAVLTLNLPPAITAATGIDAMVHATEAYTSRQRKNPLSDMMALRALQLLDGNLLRACRQGLDLSAREQMLLGSMLAGQAFANAPVAAVHALAYPIGGTFHVPHGLSNALVLPYVLRRNACECAALYAELAEAVLPGPVTGSTEARANAWVAHLEARVSASGLPTRLRDVGVGMADIPSMAEDAMRQTRLLANNPCELALHDVTAIYQQAW